MLHQGSMSKKDMQLLKDDQLYQKSKEISELLGWKLGYGLILIALEGEIEKNIARERLYKIAVEEGRFYPIDEWIRLYGDSEAIQHWNAICKL